MHEKCKDCVKRLDCLTQGGHEIVECESGFLNFIEQTQYCLEHDYFYYEKEDEKTN